MRKSNPRRRQLATKTLKSGSQTIAEYNPADVHAGNGADHAMAIEAFAPLWRRPEGRDFAAWLGLMPKQHSAAESRSSAEPRKWGSAISGFSDHRRNDRNPLDVP
jgi:transposase